jgi:hypothetical protein
MQIALRWSYGTKEEALALRGALSAETTLCWSERPILIVDIPDVELMIEE